MEENNHIKLTSAEISQLWGSYQNDTLCICMLRYFLKHVEDTEIRQLTQHALNLSQSHIPKLITMFEQADNAIPQGLTEEDVNESAPRLYSDTYVLMYIQQIGMLGMNAYSVAVATSARQDIHAYYAVGLREYIELHTMANDLLLSKGLYNRPPHIPPQEKVTFVQSNDFLQGWFGKRRPLLSLEITNLFSNSQRNALGVATLIGFSQVAQSEEVTDYLIRGKEIAAKHVEIFGSILHEDNLSSPSIMDTVTTSTTPPFSDKLMMSATTALIGIGIGYYGTSMATSPRRDLGATYGRLILEITKYANDGAKILIKNGWMEQPPMQADRNKLAKNNQNES